MIMRIYKNILYVILLLAIALPATGQVSLGVRAGVTLGELRFDRDVIDSDNRLGYCGGLCLTLPSP